MNELSELENFLYELRNAGSKYSLDRIRRLMDLLGKPEKQYPIIHIAGTNGKGSTCAMLNSILQKASLKVAMFTSPHLLYLGERIQINSQAINKADLLKYANMLKTLIAKHFDVEDFHNYPSFFEFMSALAFKYFADNNVDCAIIEVGLGGLLDSTNIVEPELSIITSISIDHTEFLGDTIAEIALQKAGIIKEGVDLLTGDLPQEALDVIRFKAQEKSSKLFEYANYADDFDLKTSLYGRFQQKNAKLANQAIKILQAKEMKSSFYKKLSLLSQEDVQEALLEVKWQARWQKINLENGVELILDASHNKEGAVVLEDNIKQYYLDKRPTICVGILGADRAKSVLEVIKKYAGKIVLFRVDNSRALSQSKMREILGECDVDVVDMSVSEAFAKDKCNFASSGEELLCTGSIYLAGEVLACLNGAIADNLQDQL